ncbi:hypothetical protein EJ04DRAFT_562712 [Polyplosphaeria fusca]|uniref:Calcineurin-like phosphoesterase domain-containing protein n=1 Tax=Polyplosphaeria fusca TaxID=682080 RepID=A0A9P4R450_9PLEO|nr:hypothetical protein EJ04DRAFT_562712 [Polyplosphaeria fusca]
MYYRLSLGFATVITFSSVNVQGAATPEALNKTSTNIIPNGEGPILYYNGTGDVPGYDLVSPDPEPITPLNSASNLEDHFYKDIFAIANSSAFASDNCTQCIAGAQAIHSAALTLPVSNFVNLLIRICEAVPAAQKSINSATCSAEFGSKANASIPYSSGGAGLGAYMAQAFSKMSLATMDMETYCYYRWDVCPRPQSVGIEESLYFDDKPGSANKAPQSSSSTLNVLHLSDWHLDPRYDIGSEANCTNPICCRPYSLNEDFGTTSVNPSLPASRFGAYLCDASPDLVLSSFRDMSNFFDLDSLSFTIFTGDVGSHDHDDQLSRALIEYEERIMFDTFQAWLGSTPVYATLGNHDSIPQAFNTQNDLNPSNGSNAMGWNYELVAGMWHDSGYITEEERQFAATHYAAYAHTAKEGLRVISLNTDLWYQANAFNYWNSTNPDTSGMLTWLAGELAACEKRGQRAWIIGHVLSGYDGSNALINPSSLFYSIVVRFSPSTIAGIFFGHTHQDQLQIFYDYLPNSTYAVDGTTYRNTTMVDYNKPLMVAHIGPSIVPLTNYNAGYQLLQIDAETFEVVNKQVYIANISESLTWTTPVWQIEYDARDVYAMHASNSGSAPWPEHAPLNATFWHAVSEAMLRNQTLVEVYNLYETKSSVMTKECSTQACARQKVCYIRSGSGALGKACGTGAGPS